MYLFKESFYVDGFDKNTNTIYEFHGCYFHGCPKCFTPDTFNVIKNQKMATIYDRHCKRINVLKANCYHLEEIWECDFDRLVESDIFLLQIKNNLRVRSPLEPRNALFGGRTNALRLHYKTKPGEKINYVDFTSLYPFVQKYKKYPIHHPEIITSNFLDIDKYFGLIKCRVLPPQKLYIPVLPTKINNKLLFTLCRTCAETNSKTCQHNENERALEGTWVSVELNCALLRGYRVLEIFEVWHWQDSLEYDNTTKNGGLFTDYINLFLKGKQEASGFPSSVSTVEEQNYYLDEYLNKEGIQLDKSKIEKNPAKRFVFKLALNSMWGRLGMNTDRSHYKMIKNESEWFEMISDDQYIINSADFSHPEIIQVFFSNLILIVCDI